MKMNILQHGTWSMDSTISPWEGLTKSPAFSSQRSSGLVSATERIRKIQADIHGFRNSISFSKSEI